LNPNSEEYCAIEVNARLSRSSALASKATGYPLAYMAAKIGLGYSLPELINRITKVTSAYFEPSLDYLVLKMPRWDFQKFELVKRKLGSAMKSVGEVMAIGTSFEEVIQKAIRMCEIGKDGLVANSDTNSEKIEDIERIEQALLHPTDDILFTVIMAIKAGMTVATISKLSAIDPWFVARIKNIVDMQHKLQNSDFDDNIIREAKELDFLTSRSGDVWE
jgi:carbamoyl-phosphate synthase large subunit